MKPDSPPAAKRFEFETLTEFQHKVLTHVANREDKTFVYLSGEPGAEDENARNIYFNEFLRLIELGFFLEQDRENPEYARMLKQFEQKGICLVIAELTNKGLWMWEQVPWENRRN